MKTEEVIENKIKELKKGIKRDRNDILLKENGISWLKWFLE